MNKNQKEKIIEMRGNGKTYAVIAAKVGLSENTVKSFCRRNRIRANQQEEKSDVCPECGLPLIHLPNKRQKRFCSDSCRLAWWKKHPENLNKKAVYNFICPACGKEFTAYGNSRRKYCSRACFGVSRRRVSDE